MSPDSVDTHSSNGTTVTSGIHSEQEEGEGATQSAEERYGPTDSGVCVNEYKNKVCEGST